MNLLIIDFIGKIEIGTELPQNSFFSAQFTAIQKLVRQRKNMDGRNSGKKAHFD